MDHTEMSERVLAAIQPIEGLLCQTMLDAVTDADTAATGGLSLPRTPAYQSVRVHMARATARAKFEGMDLAGWFVNDFERHNTALHLYTGGIAMRFLHTPTGVAPAPGHNRARRAWYTSPLAGIDEQQIINDDIKLLGLWSGDFQAGTVDLRIVHPVRPWAYGGREKVDISIPLDPDAVFTSRGFHTRDEEEDLSFPTREEAAEEAEGTANASS